MDKVRILALGGLDEDGKNMYVVEVNDSMFIIEAGLKYPDSSQQLGIEFVIPDFDYVIKNKDKLKGIFITHAHDDVVAALPYLLKEVKAPIYTGAFSANVIHEMLKKEKIRDVKVNRLKRNSKVTIDGVKVQTFPLIHSVPDTFGLAIMTSEGAIVYTSEFIIDYDMSSGIFESDFSELTAIGKKGVLALLSESQYAERSGHTAPDHRITKLIEPKFEQAQGRIIITVYHQSLYRVLEVIELAKKYKKKIYIFDKELRDHLKILQDMKYFQIPREIELFDDQFTNDEEDVVIIVSGSGKNIFRKLHTIAIKEDPRVQLQSEDTIIIASPIVSGTEKIANEMENEIYKEGGNIYTLSSKTVKSMHPSVEDLKMMLYLLKPKYYIPVKGEYRHLYMNANIALDMGYSADRIIILDNGQVAEFKEGNLVSTAEHIDLDDTLIDGVVNYDVTGVVLKDREVLSTDGVMILGIGLNAKTKQIVNGPDIQTRGFIYLKDAENIMAEVTKIFEKTITDAVANKTYENLAIRAEARDKIIKYLVKETGKRPVVLPVILEINL